MKPEVQTADDFSTPLPTNLDKKSIFDIAQRVAKNLGYCGDKDIHAAVGSLGGNVRRKDFWAEGSKESGSLVVRSTDDFTIYVPIDTSEARDRFTVAHELGHYVLHFLWPNEVQGAGICKLRASRYGSDRPEWEANWFASAFLMPEDEFKNLVHEEKYTLGQLSRHFGTSTKATSIRAEVLEIHVPIRQTS